MASTFPALLLEHARQRPHATALREKAYGIWQSLTWLQLQGLVRDIAIGLLASGLRPGASA